MQTYCKTRNNQLFLPRSPVSPSFPTGEQRLTGWRDHSGWSSAFSPAKGQVATGEGSWEGDWTLLQSGGGILGPHPSLVPRAGWKRRSGSPTLPAPGALRKKATEPNTTERSREMWDVPPRAWGCGHRPVVNLWLSMTTAVAPTGS